MLCLNLDTQVSVFFNLDLGAFLGDILGSARFWLIFEQIFFSLPIFFGQFWVIFWALFSPKAEASSHLLQLVCGPLGCAVQKKNVKWFIAFSTVAV